ncbi:hypothetical protein [Chromobacterium haemolyticum]|uniref:hypothetical protein n=1 Tax=Chromobacterium haemolyticum TaxID=394935 RepID=UPI0009DADCB0|nr:hypothetical protein [Chromobacterium haemolyticum]OQS40886.1 hypothetical protein B0T39_10410 [Chromobacterium haemolyticum]
MKILIVALCAAWLAAPALAGRLLPMELKAGTVSAANDATIEFVKKDRSLLESLLGIFIRSERQFPLAPGLRIFDEHNRFLLRGQLEGLEGRPVGVTFNMQGQINRIWVLRPEEVEMLKQREAEAAAQPSQ